MYIKNYDLYKLKYNKSYFIDIRFENHGFLYLITDLLHEIYPHNKALWYENLIKQEKTFSRVGIFEDIEVTFDLENNLVYLSDAYDDDYRCRMKNVTTSMIIEFCLEGTLNYIIIPKDNFIHLISSWAKLLEHEPYFALLYQDDNNWYNVLPFDSQEAMEKFIAEHTEQKTTLQ